MKRPRTIKVGEEFWDFCEDQIFASFGKSLGSVKSVDEISAHAAWASIKLKSPSLREPAGPLSQKRPCQRPYA